jgi:DNA-binding MarR family transcriptional regulator
MVALWEQEPLSVTELSRLLQLDPPSVSPVVKRLHAAGLVERHRDSQDERAVRLTLTSRGRALKERASTIPLAMAERLGMSVPELESIRTTLAHLISRAHGSSV